jgi:hypothetical protein
MSISEIEFELPAEQYERMGFPGLKQGESLTITLDAGVLFPEPAADSWFVVQKEPWPALLKLVTPATYLFCGQIQQAEHSRVGDEETAALSVDCAGVPVRVTCAPGEDGRLPFGVWETRYLTGFGRLLGIVEDDFAISVGQTVDVIIWGFKRLVLTPGDPVAGEWYATETLEPTPYLYDRVFITARLHRKLS